MKKKFVKVMFFGALSLAVSTTVTSCKDYDDDVQNLQTQIDNIKSGSEVSTADLKNAIEKAEKDLTDLLNKKADTSTLEKEIQDLKDALAKGGDEALLADLAQQLAEKTNLLTWENLKNDETIAKLKTDIESLNTLSETLDALVKAEQQYQANGDLSGFNNTGFSALVNSSIKSALASGGDIAAYVQTAVQNAVLADFKAINQEVSTLTGGVWKSMDQFIEDCYNKIYDSTDGILARLNELESLQETLNAFIAGNKGTYADYAAVLKQIEESRKQLTALTLPQGATNLSEAIQSIINEELNNADSSLATLKKELEDEIKAIKNMVQSVAFVPTTPDRVVNFTSLYAKEKDTDADYGTKLLAGASTQKVTFRISPAKAAEAFTENYDITFSADMELSRAAQTNLFEIVGEPTVEDGFVTYAIKSNAEKSYAVCMHVSTKGDKVSELGNTNITSDYFAAIVGKKYVMDAFYDASNVNKEIAYDDNNAVADYNNSGKIMLKISDNAAGTTPANVALTDYPGLAADLLTTTFSIDNTTHFAIDETTGKVSLTEYNLPSYVGETTNVMATVTANGFYTPATAQTIGQVEIVRTVKKATIDYGVIETAWSNTKHTIPADKFPLNKIYDDENVKLTVTEFEALKGTDATDPTISGHAYFKVMSGGNTLIATVAAQTPAGEYPIVAKFTAEGREITVNATIKVVNPAITALTVDSHLWAGTAAAGKVAFTPTLDDNNKPSSIALNFDLSKLFTNYDEVSTAVNDIDGATLAIDVPNWKNIAGLDYSTTTLTFNPATYTGKTEDGLRDAKIQIVATVTLEGTTEPIQKLTADVSIRNISGAWALASNAKKNVTLSDKSATVALAEGFSWNDNRGYAMWQDGKEVEDKAHFNSTTPLSIFGLTAPTFKFVDAEGEDLDCPYLAVNSATGELTFTDAGKRYNFVQDYEVYVKIVAASQWGEITGYNAESSTIHITIPANVN